MKSSMKQIWPRFFSTCTETFIRNETKSDLFPFVALKIFCLHNLNVWKKRLTIDSFDYIVRKVIKVSNFYGWKGGKSIFMDVGRFGLLRLNLLCERTVYLKCSMQRMLGLIFSAQKNCFLEMTRVLNLKRLLHRLTGIKS